ncbi:hypothetical protein RCL1_004865 [Eukaryota sp. TZLM3-RCL]
MRGFGRSSARLGFESLKTTSAKPTLPVQQDSESDSDNSSENDSQTRPSLLKGMGSVSVALDDISYHFTPPPSTLAQHSAAFSVLVRHLSLFPTLTNELYRNGQLPLILKSCFRCIRMYNQSFDAFVVLYFLSKTSFVSKFISSELALILVNSLSNSVDVASAVITSSPTIKFLINDIRTVSLDFDTSSLDPFSVVIHAIVNFSGSKSIKILINEMIFDLLLKRFKYYNLMDNHRLMHCILRLLGSGLSLTNQFDDVINQNLIEVFPVFIDSILSSCQPCQLLSLNILINSLNSNSNLKNFLIPLFFNNGNLEKLFNFLISNLELVDSGFNSDTTLRIIVLIINAMESDGKICEYILNENFIGFTNLIEMYKLIVKKLQDQIDWSKGQNFDSIIELQILLGHCSLVFAYLINDRKAQNHKEFARLVSILPQISLFLSQFVSMQSEVGLLTSNSITTVQDLLQKVEILRNKNS